MPYAASSQVLFWDDVKTPVGRILSAGSHRHIERMTSKPMRVLGSYTLIYVVDGNGWYRDANRRRTELRPGDSLLLFPEVAHTYGPDKGGLWSEHYVIFDGPVFDLWRESGFLCAERPIYHLEPIKEWQERLEAIVSGPRPISQAERVQEVCRFLQMLSEIALSRPPQEELPRGQGEVSRACAILETNLNESIAPETVAQMLGVSYESFRKHFRAHSGVSPARYRRQRRIAAACAMMQHSDMTNKEIASRLGFSDEHYFSRIFRETMGISSRTYRLQSRSATSDEVI